MSDPIEQKLIEDIRELREDIESDEFLRNTTSFNDVKERLEENLEELEKLLDELGYDPDEEELS